MSGVSYLMTSSMESKINLIQPRSSSLACYLVLPPMLAPPQRRRPGFRHLSASVLPGPLSPCRVILPQSKELMESYDNNYAFINVESLCDTNNNKEYDQILLQPFTHVLQVTGKMTRGKLVEAFNYWMRIPEDKLRAISEVIYLLHNASLLIDDIEDNSVLRRGIPVAHRIYGTAATINSANYVYFLGLEKVLALNHPKATTIFCEQLLELHRGQGMEIYWRDSFTCPSEEEYAQMTLRKTGGLFGLSIRLMQLFSQTQEDFSRITGILGLYFQIRNDYAILCLKEYCDSKSYCEDLTEGKFSFPVIHAIKSQPGDQQVINILRQRPEDLEVKRYCVSLLEKFGSLEHTKETMKKLEAEAREEITRLGGNPHLERVLDELRNWESL
ncbi:geranylgeranyl pyrophosphate synthase-like [Penaeus chinensis]|uniref:geranylgeranyl pyrophosphate synthase-like n=1 Tax=Penaeus chinensis TaxID=139456 RepID=UPI001FB60C2E|nr:geranylgeranyl pyrophosphate synthase-like [Penaeus chinensis]